MRTTVDIPDHLLRRAKAAAALEGKSLKVFLSEAIEAALSQKTTGARRRVELPLVPSMAPGAIELDGDRIAHVLDDEDSVVPT